MDDLPQRIAEAADLVTVALDELLPRAEGPESRLTEAMRYAALGPGKRLRTYFALETGRMFDLDDRSVLRAACASFATSSARIAPSEWVSLWERISKAALCSASPASTAVASS